MKHILVTSCLVFVSLFCFSQTVYTLGTATTSSSTASYTPYGTYYHDDKSQYLILASELIGLGASAGNVSALAFDIATANAYQMNGFTIKMGNTALSALPASPSSFEDNSTFTLCHSSNHIAAVGWNTHSFSTSFSWDGVSNVIVEICFDNTGYASSSAIKYNTTAFVSQIYGYEDSGSGCSQAYTSFSNRGSNSFRPNMQLTIGPPPTCPNPSSLSVNSITGSTANLTWTENGSAVQWDIELGSAGFSPTGIPTQSGVTNSYNYTGLSAYTSYDYYVRADCGGSDYSNWVGPYNFSTPCATFTIPYFEGFEFGYTNGVTIGGCLFQESVLGAATWMANSSNTSYNRTPRTGSFNTTLYYSNDDWIFIPIYLTTGQNYEVSLYARQDGATSTNADISINYGSSGTAAAMTNSIVTDFGIVNGGYQEVLAYFTVPSDGTYYVGILGSINGSPYYISVDDISIIVGPSCLDPTDLSASNIAGTTADLSWTENGSATSWEIELGLNGFTPTGTATNIGVWNPFPMTGLSSETSYDYYVRSDCGGGDYSNWIGPYNFTTTVSCPAPSALGVSNILSISADFSWTENGSATEWDIELGLDGFVPSGTPTSTSSSNPYSCTGLVAGTDYDYYVRASCGVGDESVWVGPYSFTTNILVGQVYIVATLGTTSGTYSTLKATFDKINDGTHQGDIVITIGGNNGETVTETSAAVLNKSGSGLASYTSVLINPGAQNIKLVSSVSGSCCVPTGTIELNNAENIIVDGRQNSAGARIDLTIENISTGTWCSAIAFVAASHNVLRYCLLKSGNTASSGIGTISIADNNVGGGSGSSFNLIEECHVTNSGSNIPRHAIGGDGASGRENYNNIIRNCSIYNFEEFGIFLGSSSSSEGYNRGWVIEGNQIYQTVSFTNTFKPQIGICVGYPYLSGSSGKEEDGTFIIRNNQIGGDGSGGYWNWTGGVYPVAGIHVYSTTDSDSSYTTIDGNHIELFNISSTNGNLGSSDKSIFTGIISNNCRTYIGNNEGNIIGSLTDDDNIVFSSSVGSGNIYGINMKTSGDQENRIVNNTISGFSITNGVGGMSFQGIHNNCATTNTSDSISQNDISFITTTKCSYFTGISGNGFICKNRVRDIDFTGSSSFAVLKGIYWYGGDVIGRGVENNEIILGMDKDGNSIALDDQIIGIDLGRNGLTFYNSVLIEGTATGSDNVMGVYVDWASGTEFKNNMIYIDRDGGSGDFYAIYNDVNSSAGWTSSNNAYVVNSGSKSTSYIGYWDPTSENISDITTWQTKSGESNSIFDTPINQPKTSLFPLLATQDNLDVDDPSWLAAGTPLVEQIDIRNSSRDATTPTIGAYEKTDIVLPIELLSFDASCNESVELKWQTSSEINNDYFVIEKSYNAAVWYEVGIVEGSGNSEKIIEYSWEENITNLSNSYYRLKQVDYDGYYSFSNYINVFCEERNLSVDVFPNPVQDILNIRLNSSSFEQVNINLYSSIGQIVVSEKFHDSNLAKIDLSNLNSGVYMLIVQDENHSKIYTQKIIVK